VLHQLGEGVDKVRAEGLGDVAIGGRPFRITRDFLDSIAGHDQAARLATLKRALLILHSPTDAIVGIENASAIFQAARHPKSFVALTGADHLLTKPGPAAYAASLIAAWVEPFLAPANLPDAPEEGHVRVGSGAGTFVQIVESSGHTFLADEPLRVGGEDLGPTPYDLLLAALGACTATTIQFAAGREGIPVGNVSVTLDHQRCHAEDCITAGEGRPRIEVIQRVITVEGELTETQRARVLVIADRCPVHRTLESKPVIKTRLNA
jgi:putative redox protein